MKRDMDLVRRIALAVEDLPPGEMLNGLDGIDRAVFSAHAIWMEEGKLAELHIADASIKRLTWDGCDFADAVRNDKLWDKAKETIIKPASSFTFSIIKDWLKGG